MGICEPWFKEKIFIHLSNKYNTLNRKKNVHLLKSKWVKEPSKTSSKVEGKTTESKKDLELLELTSLPQLISLEFNDRSPLAFDVLRRCIISLLLQWLLLSLTSSPRKIFPLSWLSVESNVISVPRLSVPWLPLLRAMPKWRRLINDLVKGFCCCCCCCCCCCSDRLLVSLLHSPSASKSMLPQQSLLLLRLMRRLAGKSCPW